MHEENAVRSWSRPIGILDWPDLAWLAPFLCLALWVACLFRPQAELPPPMPGRLITDTAGVAVPIALPYRGTAFTWCGGGPASYLENTHSPGTILYTGNGPAPRRVFRQSVLGWVYPDVANNDRIWSARAIFAGHGASEAIESLLARHAGAYLGGCGMYGAIPELRRLGLPVLDLGALGYSDTALFAGARIEASLAGRPEVAEALIARTRQAYADLARELPIGESRTGSRAHLPRILIMGCPVRGGEPLYVKGPGNDYEIYFPLAGAQNATKGWVGAGDVDAERILASNPDYIFLMGNNRDETARAFMQDPLWRTLAAARARRVYVMPGLPNSGGLDGPVFQPLWVRWMAEIIHADRLRPRLRALLRQRVLAEFTYSLSDGQIDALLRIDENIDSSGYERFLRGNGETAPPAEIPAKFGLE